MGAVKEALAAKMRQYDPIQSLRKTHSVPNIRHNMKGSYSLDSLVRLQPSESFAELNLDEKVQRRLPLSLTMSTLHEEKTGRKSRASPELSSIREQVDPPIATSTPITKSCTSDSLARPPPSKDCSPSMMSSGYESQAISSSTLSSEESLSLADEAERVVMRKRSGENLNNESFIEQYTKGAAAVQDLLQMDRVRQSVAVKEALAAKMRQYDPIQTRGGVLTSAH